jgi:hypothetical protein
VSQAYVAFYWTLPVPRRGFRTLPPDVEGAARRSRTIRYQLECIRRYVRNEKGHLVAEAAFMELATDRGTEAVQDELDRIIPNCVAHKAILLFVDFSQVHHWRPHTFLLHYLKERGVSHETLWPSEELIDGRFFDPIRHFRRWQRRHEGDAPAMRDRARDELFATMQSLPVAPGRYQMAAEALNERGITTATGRRWTAEGVRKTYVRLTAADTDLARAVGMGAINTDTTVTATVGKRPEISKIAKAARAAQTATLSSVASPASGKIKTSDAQRALAVAVAEAEATPESGIGDASACGDTGLDVV